MSTITINLPAPGTTVAALIGEDFGKYEGVPDLSTNPRYLDNLGL